MIYAGSCEECTNRLHNLPVQSKFSCSSCTHMRFRFDHAAKRGCIQRGTKIRAAFLVNNHRGLGSTDDRRLKRSDVWRNCATTMTALHYQFPRLCQRRPSGSKPCPVWAVLCHEWFSLYVPGQLQPAAAPSASAAPLPQRCRWSGSAVLSRARSQQKNLAGW